MEIILTLILFFILLSRQNNIQKELNRLKQTLNESSPINIPQPPSPESKSPENIKTEQFSQDDFSFLQENKTETNNTEKVEEHKDIFDQFIAWMMKDPLLKIGAFLMILAVAWFISYAFMNNWIGPIGRITLGIVSGSLLMLFGLKRAEKFLDQGAVFITLGGVIAIISIFVARELYSLLTPLIALGSIFLIASFMAYVSLKYKSLALSVLAIFAGGIAPLLTNTPEPSMVGLFSYLFILSASVLMIVSAMGWRILAPVSFSIVFLYNLPYIFSYHLSSTEKLNAILFAFAFALLFYLTSVINIVIHKKATNSDLALSALNALLLIIWISIAVIENFQGLISLATALVFVFGAFIVFQFSRIKEPFYTYLGIALIFIGAATIFELDGYALAIAFVIEATTVSFLASMFGKTRNDIIVPAFTLIVPFISTTMIIDDFLPRYFSLNDFIFLLITSLALFILFLQYYFVQYKRNIHISPLPQLVGVASIVYLFINVWYSLETIIYSDMAAHMFALIFYTIFGLSMYIIGVNNHRKTQIKIIGGSILGLVVIRLLSVEAWNMTLSLRIITFFVIAILLIGTAFIGNKSKEQ